MKRWGVWVMNNLASDGLGDVRRLLDQQPAARRRVDVSRTVGVGVIAGGLALGVVLGVGLGFMVFGGGYAAPSNADAFGYEFEALTRDLAFELGYSPVELRRQLVEAINLD